MIRKKNSEFANELLEIQFIQARWPMTVSRNASMFMYASEQYHTIHMYKDS